MAWKRRTLHRKKIRSGNRAKAPDRPAPTTLRPPGDPRADAALWVFLLLACLAFYGHFALGTIPVGGDNTLLYAPFFSIQWDDGPPLWNAYSMGGSAAYDNLQFALLYPPRWPFFFIEDWRDYFPLFSFLHYMIAFATSAIFLRALGFGRLSQAAGAIAFAAGGHMAGRIINPVIFYTSCWLPLLLAGATGRSRLHAWASLLGIAMICSIGSPHLMLYGLVGYAVVFLFQILWPTLQQARHDGESPAIEGLRAIAASAFHLALGVLLVAPTLLPGILRAKASVRTQTDVTANLVDSLEWTEIPLTLLGGLGGPAYPEYIDKTCYIGGVGIALILLLALRRKSWSDKRFLLGLALVATGFFFALGKNIGLQHAMPWIPGFNLLVGPARALVLTAAGLALLLALAVTPADRDPDKRPWPALILTGLSVLIFGLATMLIRLQPTPQGVEVAPYADEWFRTWLAAPGSVSWLIFPILDGATGLLIFAFLYLFLHRRERVLGPVVLALLAVQLWHFAPRVAPPLEERAFFDPPPQVAFLQQASEKNRLQPFRVATHDPLRIHDTQFNNTLKFHYLMPNIATLYNIEGLNAFDPLIPLDYLRLIEETAERSPFNDPIRGLAINRPDPRLFDLLGVRFLLGHPYDRRITHIAQTLQPGAPPLSIFGWDESELGKQAADTFTSPTALTHWLFTSLVDNAMDGPPLQIGAEVARLKVEAEEGNFTFPVRVGIDTGSFYAANYPGRIESSAFLATQNDAWAIPWAVPDWDYLLRQVNFRGFIDFGRPLHVKNVQWEFPPPGESPPQVRAFHIASQGYRLARPSPEADPWRLVSGDEQAPAPVFEYTRAQPRAAVVERFQASEDGKEIVVDEAALRMETTTSTALMTERRVNSMRLTAEAAAPSLLVLREMWTPGWRAWVNGQEAPVLRVNGLFRGVELPAGSSLVELNFRPTLFFRLLALDGVILVLLALFEITRVIRRRRSQ